MKKVAFLVPFLLLVTLIGWVFWPTTRPTLSQDSGLFRTDAIAPGNAIGGAGDPSSGGAVESPEKFPLSSPEAPQVPVSPGSPTTGVTGVPPSRPPGPPGGAGVTGASASGPVGSTVAEVLKGVDMNDPQARAWATARIGEIQEAQKDAAYAKALQLGIPTRIEGPGNQVSEIFAFRGDRPVYRRTQNKNAAISSGANLLFPPTSYNLTGSGVKVGVWDGGSVRSTHQELTGRVTLKNSSVATDDHATHVAGTIGASGVQALAKGMASLASIDSYDWNSDYAEMTAAGSANASQTTKIPLSNHSYGYNAVTDDMGQYNSGSESVDAVAASLPYYLPFWAAGNEQDVLTALGGFQSITYDGLAKNIMTVGAVDDAVSGIVRSLAPATIASFSSLGPCDDGRIKPDLVANGIGVYSSIKTNNTAYDTYDGTSMATPSAAGSSALIVQLYAREFSGQLMRASTLKGLLIHSADDLGNTGPDYTYGWGLINVKKAADVILAHKASLASPKIIENTVTNALKTRTQSFVWDGVSPIRATLCWTDPAGVEQTVVNSRTPNLVHNLDLKITAPNGTTVYQPYVMPFVGTWTLGSMSSPATTGKNNVDNVEQVYLATPTQAGTYTVTVSLDGSLTTPSQTYSLVVTGGTNVAANPPPSVQLTGPADGATYLSGQPVSLSATATDTVVGGGAGVVSQVEFFSGTSSLSVDPSAPYTFSWTPPSPGIYVLNAQATDSEGASATSPGVTIAVLTGDGTPTIGSFSPSNAAVGASVVITGGNFAGVTAVRFNGIDASSFTVDSLTQITATVPSLATSGPISVVTGRGTATSVASFTPVQSAVVISQVYGGGGQAGSTLVADFVELRNRTGSAVGLAGWSMQYASASGTSWQATALSGTIPANGYYLIKLASSGSSGSALPSPDVTGSINMSATQGKIALRSSTSQFSGSSPIGQTGLQDLVGYGSANTFEGSAAAPSPSTTLAIFRAGGGTVDSGDNAADFSTASPNPRNSSGGVVAPVITSTLTAGGTVGSSFNYSITASNGPASYGATNLPAGVTVNTSTGLISGTPTVSGTFTSTISATNTAGTGSASLVITIISGGGGGGGGGGTVTIFSENIGTPSGTTAIASHSFQNSSTLTFSGTADVRNTTLSSGYAGASGAGNVFITNTLGRFFEISNINTSSYSALVLSFGQHKSTIASDGTELEVEVSSDGTTYTPLTLTPRATGSGTADWVQIMPTGTIPSTANLRIRFRQTSSTTQFRVDDVVLTGTAASTPTPVITATGTPAAAHSTYGSASVTPATFTLSGSHMTAGISVTASAGFEISKTSGGASGYAASQTVGAAGTIASTTVYVRLAAGTGVGSYSGNIVCTSTGALPVNVATTSSEVRRKVLTVTANNRSKVFGSTLSLGTSAFSPVGLVGSETIGSVTLAASGGTGLYDYQGTYDILPSNASGGTFDPANYDVSYLPGVLTVTGQSFATWLGGIYSGDDALPTADPDENGLSHAQEYFYGLAPGDFLAPGQFKLAIVGNQMSVEYPRSKSAAGVSGVAQWSNLLGAGQSWSAAGITDTFVSDEGEYEIRKAVLTLQPGELRKFMRVNVTVP
jgi:hypothetical protein